MRDFKGLLVWKKAHQLTVKVYSTSANFPKEEIYGITNQLRRACASVGANIAEGCGRGSNEDFARFLHISSGSASEAQYHLILAKDLGFLGEEIYKALEEELIEVKRMLTGLTQKLKHHPTQPQE